MIIIIFFWLLALFFYLKQSKQVFLIGLIVSILCLFSHFMFVIEVSDGNLSYFNSDEIGYFTNSGLSEAAIMDRKLWFLINTLVSESFFIWMVCYKVINIPVLLFLSLLLQKITKCYNAILLPIFLPYLMYLATVNLRDLLIILMVVWSCYHLGQSYWRKRLYVVLPIFLLFFLRPFASLIVVGVYLVIWFYKRFLGSAISKKVFIVSVFAIMLISVYFIFSSKISSYLFSIEMILSNSDDKRDLSIIGIVNSVVIFVLSPRPISLLERTLDGGSLLFGLTDDVFRTINQFFYYGMFLLVLFRLKKILSFVKKFLPDGSKLLLAVFVAHVPIYAVYYGGGGHLRIKIPIMILIFILFLVGYGYKTNELNEIYLGKINEK